MKTIIQPDEPDPIFICPICHKPVTSYIQDAYHHVLFNHMDKVREQFNAEQVNLFMQGFTWERYTNDQLPSNE